jgi:hypothetical protein
MSTKKIMVKSAIQTLDEQLERLEKISHTRIPGKEDTKEYFNILGEYIQWVDTEGTKKYSLERGVGFSNVARAKIHEEENELAINLVRYARTNQIMPEVKKKFKEYKEELGFELLSEMYFNMALQQLSRLEKSRQKYVDSLK